MSLEENKDELQEEVKSYTQEDLDKAVQAESDKRVSGALKTAQAKWEEEYQAKLEAEKSEAEKLGSMSAEERAKAEFEKEKNDWNTQRAEFEKEKMELQATKLLGAEGLPISFVNYVLDESAEAVTENIKTFKSEWQKALDEAVTNKLKGKAPVSSGLHNKDLVNMTKEEFGKLPYKERSRMLSVDPDIVRKLKD